MELRDPRLGMVTLTAVELSKDLGFAKVYFTVFEEDKVETSKAVLAASSGFLKHRLSEKITVRSLPSLNFHYDESIERGRKISSLIENAMEKDSQQGQGKKGDE